MAINLLLSTSRRKQNEGQEKGLITWSENRVLEKNATMELFLEENTDENIQAFNMLLSFDCI